MRRGRSQNPGAAVAAPGFNVHSKTAPSPPLTRWRRGGRASVLHAARQSAPAGAGRISMAPRRNGRGLWGYAPACCGRLCESVPSSTLAVRLYVTKDGSPTRRPALPYGASTPPLKHVAASGGKGRSRFVIGVGLARVRAQAGAAVMRGCRGRPCLLSGAGGPCVLGLS